MYNRYFFFSRAYYFILTVFLLALTTSCTKRGKTFEPPASDSTKDAILSAISKVGNEYKTYAISNAHSQIKIQAIAVSVKNDMKTFAKEFIQNGTMGISFEPLKPSEIDKVTRTISKPITDYLRNDFQVSDTASYKILILIYGSNAVNFDGNQNPSGELDAQILFLDTKSKLILWHADASGNAKDVETAAQYASSNINQKLHVLFGETKN